MSTSFGYVLLSGGRTLLEREYSDLVIYYYSCMILITMPFVSPGEGRYVHRIHMRRYEARTVVVTTAVVEDIS